MAAQIILRGRNKEIIVLAPVRYNTLFPVLLFKQRMWWPFALEQNLTCVILRGSMFILFGMLATLNSEKILNLTMQVIERVTFMLVCLRVFKYSPISAQLRHINTKVQRIVHFTHSTMPQIRSILYDDDVGYFARYRRWQHRRRVLLSDICYFAKWL
jgi:hypothetical protein